MKKYIPIFLISLVIYFIISPLRGYGGFCELQGFTLSALVYWIVYYVFTIWALNKCHTKLRVNYIIPTILLGAIIVEIPLRIIYFEDTLISIIDFAARILSILSGWVFFSIRNRYGKIVWTVVTFSICICGATYGTNLWLHKLDFGTFTGTTVEAVKVQPVFQTETGDSIQLNEINARYVVLDFFSSSCSVCRKKFPIVKQMYDKYIDNTNVKFFSVHARARNENIESGAKLLADVGYKFPCISINGKDSALHTIGVTAYPTVIIYERATDKIIFRGSIEYAANMLAELTSVN